MAVTPPRSGGVVELLGDGDAGDVVAVLSDAFANYPVMRYVIGPAGDDYDEYLRLLVGFFVAARVLRGEPMLGVRDPGGDLVAAAILTPPGDREPPAELAVRREHVWERLGPGARDRYTRLGEIWREFAVSGPDLHLNMIGVRRAAMGTGLGRRLLDAVHNMAARDETATGVTLTTETAANVGLYERFGYRVVGHARVADDLETWGFFRPNDVGLGKSPDR